MVITVSYIVPLYNSEKTFEQCLSSIIAQAGDFFREIILIDNSKKKQAVFLKKTKKAKYCIKHYHFKKYFYAGHARNIGLQKTTGDYIACIDSDVIINPTWTQMMLNKYKKLKKQNKRFVISGSLENYQGIRGIIPKCLFFWEFYKMTSAVPPGFVQQIQSNNLFFERQLIQEKLLFFPEVKYAEDIIWAKRFRKKGLIYLYAQNIAKHITGHCFYKHAFRLGVGAATYRISYIRSRFVLLLIAPIMPILRFFNVVRYMKKLVDIKYLPIMFLCAALYFLGFLYACCVDDLYYYS